MHQFYIETWKTGDTDTISSTFSYPPTRQLITFLRKLQRYGHFIVFLKDMTTGKDLLNRRK